MSPWLASLVQKGKIPYATSIVRPLVHFSGLYSSTMMICLVRCSIYDRHRHYDAGASRIQESPNHLEAKSLLQREILDGNNELALSPQVLTEFLHVVTDPRRFERPLPMDKALRKAQFWWNAREVRHVYPTFESTMLFLEWLHQHQLGRKRLLDTYLAATLWTAGVRKLLSSNVRDFRTFPDFEVISS